MIPLTIEQIETVIRWLELNSADKDLSTIFMEDFIELLFQNEPNITYFKN